jgi:hypothetical protein
MAVLGKTTSEGPSLAAMFARPVILLLPTALLLGCAVRWANESGSTVILLWVAVAFQMIVCGLTFVSRFQRQALGPSVITLYLVALAWLWCTNAGNDWYGHLTKATLLVVPLAVFGYQTLIESGAPAVRRATILADRLGHRKEWPAELSTCRALPEVKALRAALNFDAAPALALLDHPRTEVRVAALVALEFRKEWRPGQAEMVLQAAQRAEEPAIRAAAVCALGNVDDRSLVEMLAQFMYDPSAEVRKAATEALLWDTENRWCAIRYIVRRVLADPLYGNDGALFHEGQLLTPDAVNDLMAWCAEKGVLAARAALTLGYHYNRALTEQPDDKLVNALKAQLADPLTPAVLRIELGRVLQSHQELDLRMLEKMLLPSNPAPLRLIAVELLLSEHKETPAGTAALTALRDLARLPNREIALSTADVIQRRLGVDLGLALGQPLPPVHSRQAADITRRVMVWASQYDLPDNIEDSRPLQESRA